MSERKKQTPLFTRAYPNLALERLGTRITGRSDEFFAPATRSISPEAPIFIPGKFDDHGKWMDGWESRRRRQNPPDHDWMSLRLGAPAHIFGINVCTRHFTGNYPPAAAIDAAKGASKEPKWQEVVKRFDVNPDSDNYVSIEQPGPWRQLRLRIYPDGGIARLRVHGLFVASAKVGSEVDLASILHGARVLGCSDAHFGAPSNLLLPDQSINMGDGWETARRRGPGHDWVVIELGSLCTPSSVRVETYFFKGNYPATCSVQSAQVSGSDADVLAASSDWPILVEEQKLGPDSTHQFKPKKPRRATHLRLNIFPDGGVSRLRVMGKVAK